MRLSSALCILGLVASLAITGCASVKPVAVKDRAPMTLQRPDEQLLISRSGRFVLQVTRRGAESIDQGTQGQFEWIEMRSGPQQARQLLLFLGPLGQSGPSLERALTLGRAGMFTSQRRWLPDTVRVFDEQGHPLIGYQQRLLLARLVGAEASAGITSSQFNALLTSVMNVMQTAVHEPDAMFHRVYTSDALGLSLRVAFDASTSPSADPNSDASR